jgi:hypothetical protein
MGREDVGVEEAKALESVVAEMKLAVAVDTCSMEYIPMMT